MSARPDDATMINTLWFDKDGCGPDHFQLRLHPFKAEMDGAIPASLGIRVHAGDLVIKGASMIDGGFNMARSEVAELHRQLGQWLVENP